MSDPNPELDPAFLHRLRLIGLCILLGSVVIIASVVDWASRGRLLGD